MKLSEFHDIQQEIASIEDRINALDKRCKELNIDLKLSHFAPDADGKPYRFEGSINIRDNIT